MEEKDYVDVQDLIKSSNEQQQQEEELQHQQHLLNEKLNEGDAISQLIRTQFDNLINTISDEDKLEHVVLQEPDSTTTPLPAAAAATASSTTSPVLTNDDLLKTKQVEPTKPTTTTGGCSYCEFSERLLELIYFHPKVDEVLTWKDPKISGALLAALLITLISVATFSLLSIVGFVLLASMTIIGGYRLYLTILNRIKGHTDECFNKLLAMKLNMPNNVLQDVLNVVEKNGNEYLNKLKQIVLWENLTTSGVAYFVAYIVYSLGCALNAVTLLILLVLFAFTWPKVYKMYKVQIDQGVKTAHNQIVDVIGKIKEKVPFLNKKKLQ